MKIRLIRDDEMVVKKATLPFIQEVHRLIAKYPEYIDGIAAEVVHIGFNPGHAPKPAHDNDAYRAAQEEVAQR
jgi:hypothetical protein